jgi:hypothetical protein
MDATAGREPTWDAATARQGGMSVAASEIGGTRSVAFYRASTNSRSALTSDGRELARLMSVRAWPATRRSPPRHAEQRREPHDAVVFVGDRCEEDVDEIGHEAGQLEPARPAGVAPKGETRSLAGVPADPKLTRGVGSSTVRAPTSCGGFGAVAAIRPVAVGAAEVRPGARRPCSTADQQMK